MSEQVWFLESLAANAWPAAVVQQVGGWRLRFDSGYSRRANSVWPNEWTGRFTLDERIAIVEAFYARHGAVARFQICPAALPAGLDDVLAARGYSVDATTAVQTAPLAAVLPMVDAVAPAGRAVLNVGYDPAWFAAQRALTGLTGQAVPVRRALLQRIAVPVALLRLEVDDRPVALGAAALEAGWAGIFNMFVAPAYRRQGLGRVVLAELARWSRAAGATQLYLQVMIDNPPALALYSGLGFVTQYHYHYRQAPAF